VNHFNQELPPSPLQHYEEQFSSVWPWLMLGLLLVGLRLRFWRREHARLVAWVAIASISAVVSALRQSASTWREDSRVAFVTRKHKPPIGTVLLFGLNEPATVTLTFTQPNTGRKVRSKCVAPNRSNHRKRHCTPVAGILSFSTHAGANHIHFQGRLSRTDNAASLTFTIIN
jgi:hypothetical protein